MPPVASNITDRPKLAVILIWFSVIAAKETNNSKYDILLSRDIDFICRFLQIDRSPFFCPGGGYLYLTSGLVPSTKREHIIYSRYN